MTSSAFLRNGDRIQELEERGEELRVHGPPLLLRRQREDAADEDAVRHDLEPGVREARSLLECAR